LRAERLARDLGSVRPWKQEWQSCFYRPFSSEDNGDLRRCELGHLRGIKTLEHAIVSPKDAIFEGLRKMSTEKAVSHIICLWKYVNACEKGLNWP